jgi:DNA polymerase-3 subunit epsilon
MAWYDERLCAFDVETTSVDPEQARIVQAHLVFVGGGQAAQTNDWLIDPGVPIPAEATKVHGITDERVRAEGQAAPHVIGMICFAVAQTIRKGVPIVAYNAPYDLTVLDRECRRHGPSPPDWSAIRVIDPLVIDKWADRFRRGSRRLAAVCEHYGVELGTDAHDAGADALAAARLAWKMTHKADLVRARHPEIINRRASWKRVREDLDALEDAQRLWASEQAIGLRAYFEGRGEHEKAATVHGHWPLIPFVPPADRTAADLLTERQA